METRGGAIPEDRGANDKHVWSAPGELLKVVRLLRRWLPQTFNGPLLGVSQAP
jgi:hypothetical protein